MDWMRLDRSRRWFSFSSIAELSWRSERHHAWLLLTFKQTSIPTHEWSLATKPNCPSSHRHCPEEETMNHPVRFVVTHLWPPFFSKRKLTHHARSGMSYNIYLHSARSRFLTNLYIPQSSSLRNILATYPAHPNLPHFTTLTAAAGLYTPQTSSLRNIHPNYIPSPS